MIAGLDRVAALDRALADVRYAERMLLGLRDPEAWRGPARDAFAEACDALRMLLGAAESAIDRERSRALVALHEPGLAEP